MPRLPRAVSVLLLWVAAAAAVAAPPPVLLWYPPPLDQPEVPGIEKLEVSLEVTVDGAGRATLIKVLWVKPSGSWDREIEAYFAREIVRWRWAPSAEPVRVHRLMMPVTPRGPHGERFGQSLLRQPTNTEERAPWFARPLEEQVGELERLLGIVQRHLDPSSTRRIETPRFVVLSDYGHAGSVESLASNLEAALVTLDQMFATIEPQPMPTRTIAIICRNKRAFDGLMRDFEIYDPRVLGIFRAPGLLVFHAEVSTPEELLSVMVHEATHVWTERMITRPGHTTPEWLSEGLAEYIGNSRIRRGVLEPGRTLRHRYTLGHWGGVIRGKTSEGSSIDAVKRDHKAGLGLTVAQLLQADRRLFYGASAGDFYPSAWMLIHFLRHGGDGWEERFSHLLLAIAEGFDPFESLVAIYEMPEAELENRYAAWVARF